MGNGKLFTWNGRQSNRVPEKLGAKGKELIQQPKKATEEAQNASRKPKPPREQGKVA